MPTITETLAEALERILTPRTPDEALASQLDDYAHALAALAQYRAQQAQPEAAPTMPRHWSVEVNADGETLVSIGSDWLSGERRLEEADERTIIGAAKHLLSFVGYGLPPSNFDPDAAQSHVAADDTTGERVAEADNGERVAPWRMRVAAIAAECSDPDTTDALDKLLEDMPASPQAGARALSEERIREIWVEHGCDGEDAEGFARAIEAAHGISTPGGDGER